MTETLKQLCEIASINPKFDAQNMNGETTISFVPMAAVSETLGTVTREEQRPLAEVIKGFTPFLNGDILIAKITPCFENGKIALARLSRQVGFGSTEFHVVRPFPHLLDTQYAYHFLRQPSVRREGESRMTGSAGQRRVPKSFIESLKIPLPPLAEQKRMAAILDEADALRRKRREAIAKLDTLLQSVFLDMFGDPVTNPKGWQIKHIGDCCSVATGGTPSRGVSEFYTGNIPWVKTSEVVNEIITETEEKISAQALKSSNCQIFPVNTLLLAMYGQGLTRGRTAKLGIPATTNQACAAILPSENVVPDYLWFFLKMAYEQIRDLGRGGNQPNMNLSIVRSIQFPLPPKIWTLANFE